MQFYCESFTEYKRLKTREVRIGDLLLGNPDGSATHPIRIQTMTTTDTMVLTALRATLFWKPSSLHIVALWTSLIISLPFHLTKIFLIGTRGVRPNRRK